MGRFSKLEFNGGDDGDLGPRPEHAQPEACFMQAEREYREGNFSNALRLYSRALEGDRLMVEAWRRQLVMLIEMREWHEAVLWADKSMELFPNDPDLLSAKATALCRIGDALAALRTADEAIRVPGANPYPWIARGEVLLFTREGHHEYCFNKALVAAPAGWLTFAQVGRVYQFHGLYSKALEYYNRAMTYEPGIPFLMVQAAVCRRHLGMKSQARQMLEEVLRLNPRNVNARKELAALKSSSLGSLLAGFCRRLKGK